MGCVEVQVLIGCLTAFRPRHGPQALGPTSEQLLAGRYRESLPPAIEGEYLDVRLQSSVSREKVAHSRRSFPFQGSYPTLEGETHGSEAGLSVSVVTL